MTGGLPYNRDDHKRQLELAKRHGITDKQLASILKVPIDYIAKLREEVKANESTKGTED